MLKIDSCSLIYLAKSDLLPVAARLYRDLKITRSVYEEVVVEGKKRSRPDAFLVASHIQERKLGIVDFEGELPAEMAAMGRGESETMMESKSERCTALLDDIRSKAYAARSGIEYTSADILLIEALARRKITLEEFGDFAQKLGKASGMRAERFAELLRIGMLLGGAGK